jgi:hypothetical protein
MTPLVKLEISTETVLCAAGGFEVHPESYNPRVFVRVMNPEICHYELLTNGWFLDWPSLPPEGFPDYMLFVIDDIHCFSKIKQKKHPRQIEMEAA